MKNVPYKKEMKGDVITNPITKENPYINEHPIGIIYGFELLLDSPDIKKGIIGKCVFEGGIEIVSFKSEDNGLDDSDWEQETIYSRELCLSKPEWFKPLFKQPTISIGGVDIEFKKEFILIEGVRYNKSEIKTIQNLMNKGHIRSLNVGCTGQHKVDPKTITQILNRLG